MKKRITKLGHVWLDAELRERTEKTVAFLGRDRTIGNNRPNEDGTPDDNCGHIDVMNAARVHQIDEDLSGKPTFVDLPTQVGKVVFGHIVSVTIDDGQTQRAARVMLDGYSHDLRADFVVINVLTSPLAQAILDCEVGDQIGYRVAGRTQRVTVDKIELPRWGDLKVFAAKRRAARGITRNAA